MNQKHGATAALLVVFTAGGFSLGFEQSPAQIAASAFIYDDASFPSAHASTIVETRSGLVAAWFGGTAEGHRDVAVWLSRHDGRSWSVPVEVANGLQRDGSRYPCWNPVLFQPNAGPLLLFYKVGPNPREWWGAVRISSDDGRSWSGPILLPDGVLGPVRAKPVELETGVLLAGSSTEHDGWVVHMERLSIDGRDWRNALASADRWTRTKPLNDPEEHAAIQPTILVHTPSELQILCRSRQGVITEAWSNDAGRSWGAMTATTLPNPSAGIDALRLQDGRFLLVYNPTERGRNKLAVAVSDDGRTWHPIVVLEDSPGEYSYPAVIQSQDGRVQITYTWNRKRIKHVVLDSARMGREEHGARAPVSARAQFSCRRSSASCSR